MRFIVTRELGRLAKWLRIMGYDASYFDRDQRRELIVRSLREDRIILTRDSHMGRYSGVRMVHIDSDFVEEQVKQVLVSLKLHPDKKQLFSRCVVCNEPLAAIEKEAVKDKVAPYVYQTQQSFMHCAQCKRVYWQGTHWMSVMRILKETVEAG